MAHIAFIGTGGSVATAGRDNASLLIDAGGLILVDCPGSIVQKIKKLGCKPEDADRLLVTHIHPDHIYGLPSLVHSLMEEEGELILYGSEESTNFCGRLLDLFRLRRDRIKYRVRLHPLHGGEEFQVRDALIRTLAVPHSPASLAFRFVFPNGKELLYSGDTPCYSPLFAGIAGIDYLIHDCSAPERFFVGNPELRRMHTSSLDLGREAAGAGVHTLFPIHIFGDLKFTDAELWAEIRENYKGALIIPQDFENIPL